MAIMDKLTTLLPWRGGRSERRPAGEAASGRADTRSLREDLDRWLQRLTEDPWRFPAFGAPAWTPSTEVRETEDEVVVTVELPGLDRDDVELVITPQGLTVRGEKQEEYEDVRGDVYVSERRYGSFVRTVPLPDGLDLDRAEARVEHGVLTVRFPKIPARARARRIPITT